MFEITPKEQLLKNVRKGLIQPLSNKYPLLNFEKDVLKKPLIMTDESFIKFWVENGFLFNVYSGYFDLLFQLKEICETYKLGIPTISEKNLVNLFTENEIPFNGIEKLDRTIFCGFSKLEITTNSLFFSSELHPLKYFNKAENIILYGKSSQIESPENNKYFSELMIKNDLKVQLSIDYFKSFKSVFLFIEE